MTYISRSINKFGFSCRVKTISQSVPEDWLNITKKGTQKIRHEFITKNVDVVLAADELMIRFHEASNSVIAPKGIKRVGTGLKVDDKAGCTVLPTMDMLSNRLLPPVIIFNGVLCATLMAQWQNHTPSLVMFTPSHWMVKETFILYVKWLMMIYASKRIGLIIDYAPSHSNNNIDQWICKLNNESTDGTFIVIGHIDKGLTSVYQPGDLVINKLLRDIVRQQYYDHVTNIIGGIKPGMTLKVSREKLVDFIEYAVNKINQDVKKNHLIFSTFEKCGLNPWSEDLSKFDDYLKSLSENDLYKAFIQNQTALNME